MKANNLERAKQAVKDFGLFELRNYKLSPDEAGQLLRIENLTSAKSIEKALREFKENLKTSRHGLGT